MNQQIDFADVQAASACIRPHVHNTPVLSSRSLNASAGAECLFKCENFHKTRSLKFRGAGNAVFSMPDKKSAAGVVTHSSGNHAAALALAARERHIQATIVMPENALSNKVKAVESYGARIVFCKDS